MDDETEAPLDGLEAADDESAEEALGDGASSKTVYGSSGLSSG